MNQIILTNWNLIEAEKIIINHCLNNNLDKSFKDLSQLLGISERTLYRKINDYNIPLKPKKLEFQAISFLTKKGYKIEKL